MTNALSSEKIFDAKKTLLSIIQLLGGNQIAKRLLKDKPRILMYHKVVPNTYDNSVGYGSVDQFEKIIAYLSANYKVMTLKNLVQDFLKKGIFEDDSVVITFDDGFLNFLQQAFPILKKYQIPATVFICPELINKGHTLWTEFVQQAHQMNAINSEGRAEDLIAELDKLSNAQRSKRLEEIVDYHRPDIQNMKMTPESGLMNWDDIAQLQASGLIEIGSHTLTHPKLCREDKKLAAFEIGESRRLIEDKLGVEVYSFCYPYGKRGDYRVCDVESVRASGYLCAVTADYGLVDTAPDLFQLPRFGGDFSTFSQGKKYIDGVEYFQRKFLRDD